jgi:hypothetical protein
MEQEEYTKEEINWSYIEFVDNQDVLDLIEKVFYFCLTLCFISIIFICLNDIMLDRALKNPWICVQLQYILSSIYALSRSLFYLS